MGAVLDGGAATGESLLHRYTDAFDKVLVPVFLLQLFIKLRCKYSQKLGVTRDERAIGVGSTKNDSVARSSADDRAGAALLNALEVVGKDIHKVRVVFNGAGAAGIACAEHYVRLGVKRV